MKKINKKIIFGAFSILDIIIIFIVITALLIGYIIMSGGNIKDYNKTIIYTVEVVEVEQNLVDDINIDDILYDARNNNEVGKVMNVNVINSYLYLYDYEDKIYKKSEIEDKYNLYIEIESNVYETESNLLIDNLDIKAGKEISLKGKGYYIYGRILNIER